MVRGNDERPIMKPYTVATNPILQVVDKYGADALRLYLVNSPVVRAEPLRFEEAGVFGVVKDVFLPWYNAYRFLCQNVVRLSQEGATFQPAQVLESRKPSNVLDRWILAATRQLVNTVRCLSVHGTALEWALTFPHWCYMRQIDSSAALAPSACEA
jgi:isoleucyl-tRNA synthetase